MTEQLKIIENYAPETLEITKDDFRTATLYSIPMRLFLYPGQPLRLSMEVWEGKESFEAGMAANRLTVGLELPYGDAKTLFPEFFNAIESSAFAWLGVTEADYYLEKLDINLTNLFIEACAQHKTRPAKEVTDKTTTLEEFEEMKAVYPQLVEAYYAFARTYSKQRDWRLAKFN